MIRYSFWRKFNKMLDNKQQSNKSLQFFCAAHIISNQRQFPFTIPFIFIAIVNDLWADQVKCPHEPIPHPF